ncbi:bacteriohemerythrin [Marichromatium sp. AB31]|uniref:bacteriohemerythrin n=1 Tax=Marichromatium sp. AB31 TaxID=2483362 RepID=UPI000F3D3DBE|nr:hemerythrin family protein [Marichromatium sp. AB31]MBO8087722.1 hemerythrin family protein [Marichromatium sp.]RNE91497.1 hemerythrin [Marichromatium sp. AB31]
MLKEWSDVYSIGIPEIDEQHRCFFSASHRLYNEILDRKGKEAVEGAVSFMREYAERHFSTEEAFMNEHGYPDLKAHLQQHAAFFRRLDILEQELQMFGPTQDLAERALDITQDWLIDHIADEDMLYSLHIKSGDAA